MKQILGKLTFAIVLIGAFVFTACSDDDNHIQIEKDLNGEYKSEMQLIVTEIGSDGTEKQIGEYLVPQNFTVSRSAEGGDYMDLVIKDIRFSDQNWGDLTLQHLKVGFYAGRYTIVTEADQDVHIDGIGECSVNLVGSGNTQAVSNVIYVNAGSQQFELIVTGTKLSGSESSEGVISTFKFDENYDKVNAVVTQQPQISGKNIVFHVAPGSNITGLKPTVTTTPEETTKLYPSSNTAVDFTNPVTYIVVAEDGTRIEYTVTAIIDE